MDSLLFSVMMTMLSYGFISQTYKAFNAIVLLLFFTM